MRLPIERYGGSPVRPVVLTGNRSTELYTAAAIDSLRKPSAFSIRKSCAATYINYHRQRRFVLAIALSRLLLYDHSAPEVGLGLVIGYSAKTICRAWLSLLPVVGAAVVLVLHGREIGAEYFLHAIAEFLRIRCT